MKHTNNWDQFFYNICEALASKSPCLSRQLGAVLVRDNHVISTGYNGPPKGVSHCGHDRLMEDSILLDAFNDRFLMSNYPSTKEIKNTCPRQLLGLVSGEGLHLCPAAHAERNTIVTAAKLGVSVENTTLYLNCNRIPCVECLKEIINVGIKEIVIEQIKFFDDMSKFLLHDSDIKVRKFVLDE